MDQIFNASGDVQRFAAVSMHDAKDQNQLLYPNESLKHHKEAQWNKVREKIDSSPSPIPAKTDWAISSPSQKVTVSAETKARWELLRALAGVKKDEEHERPKLEASVKDPTQLSGLHSHETAAAQLAHSQPAVSVTNPTQIPGRHPHEIVAAQVLKSSRPRRPEDSDVGQPVGSIHRRNASHGRLPKPPGAPTQQQTQGSDGSHRLRPLMLPKMVSRSTSGRKAGNSGNIPIVRSSVTPDPHHAAATSISLPRLQLPLRPGQAQKPSAPHIQAPKPVQPPAKLLSGLGSGLLSVAGVPSAPPTPFSTSQYPGSGNVAEKQAPHVSVQQVLQKHSMSDLPRPVPTMSHVFSGRLAPAHLPQGHLEQESRNHASGASQIPVSASTHVAPDRPTSAHQPSMPVPQQFRSCVPGLQNAQLAGRATSQIRVGSSVQATCSRVRRSSAPSMMASKQSSHDFISTEQVQKLITTDAPLSSAAIPISGPMADRSPEELLLLLASGDPATMVFIYTEEGIEWLISMFLYGGALIAKSWVDQNLLSKETKALLEWVV